MIYKQTALLLPDRVDKIVETDAVIFSKTAATSVTVKPVTSKSHNNQQIGIIRGIHHQYGVQKITPKFFDGNFPKT